MKVYISSDIEGVTGITAWEETARESADYRWFRDRMAIETRAACEGALAAGADEIVVKDAHETGRNLEPDDLPEPCRLIRGWSGHPLCMVQELDETFDAVAFIGWHGAASDGGNPLAHTLDSSTVHEIRIDGVRASEFRIHAFAAGTFGVPVVFVSGDASLCAEVEELCPSIRTCAVKTGHGAATHSRHPDVVYPEIRNGMREALEGDRRACLITPPEHAEVEVVYHDQVLAYRRSWYPGAKLASPTTVRYAAEGWFEAMRFLAFVT